MKKVLATFSIWTFLLGMIFSFLGTSSEAALGVGVKEAIAIKLPEADQGPNLYNRERRNQLGNEAVPQASTDLPIGDINGNGYFDFEDAVFITQVAYGVREATEEELAMADLDGNGEVDKWDAFLAALVFSGIITLDEAKGATPESLGVDENGYYTRTESSVDLENGTVHVKMVIVGNISDEALEKMMKMLEENLKRLIEMLAKMKEMDSDQAVAFLTDVYHELDEYLFTNQLPKL